MKKIYSSIIILCIANMATAQIPEDALRLTWQPSYGSARYMAIGGTMTGLGGEITAAHTNPAGLGFYKNGDLVFSPGFNFGRNTIDYRNQKNLKGDNTNAFNLGTSGVIIAGEINDNKKIKSAALSFTINKLADYNNSISYKGYNNLSSGAERYAEEFSAAKQTPNDALNNKYISLPTRLALYSYLIDTLTLNGKLQVVAFPEFTNGVNQTNTITTSGGVHELALGLAVNKDEKLFLGASLGLPIMNYTRETYYSETDGDTASKNGFAYYNYKETLKTSGIGFNAKIGLIYRPVERVRLGLSINSPTYYNLVDETRGTMNVKTENLSAFPNRVFANTTSITEQVLSNGAANIESRYTFRNTWKIAAGASYVFREIANVKKQRAFIAADVEYVTYKSMHYNSTLGDETGNINHYKSTNEGIKAIYKNAFNAKIGGEVKFNTIMLRLGGAYYGNPNKDAANLKQDRINISGGLGYRHKGIFIDATYVHQINRSVDMPYRLADKANTFANVNNRTGNVMLTFGTKF